MDISSRAHPHCASLYDSYESTQSAASIKWAARVAHRERLREHRIAQWRIKHGISDKKQTLLEQGINEEEEAAKAAAIEAAKASIKAAEAIIEEAAIDVEDEPELTLVQFYYYNFPRFYIGKTYDMLEKMEDGKALIRADRMIDRVVMIANAEYARRTAPVRAPLSNEYLQILRLLIRHGMPYMTTSNLEVPDYRAVLKQCKSLHSFMEDFFGLSIHAGPA
jgi:hypothetical protein